MNERVSKCPQCHAPLEHSRFARQVTCSFCRAQVNLDPSVVSASKYRKALEAWNAPAEQGFANAWTLGGTSWTAQRVLAEGDRYRIYLVDRARLPRERAVLRVALRETGVVERTVATLKTLRNATPEGMARVIPELLGHGLLEGGPHPGAEGFVVRFRSHFRYPLTAVRAAFPQGVEPRVALWAWRRVLESLALIHRAGFVHGAVLPAHVILEENDHGAMLVGFSSLRPLGAARAEADLIASARMIAYALGGDASGSVPASVPRPLAALLRKVAGGELGEDGADAWTLRETLGAVSREAFGAPSFNPLRMPA